MKKFLEFNISDKVIYCLWVVIGIDYLSRAIIGTIYGVPGAFAWFITFMWFAFWAMDSIMQKRWRQMYRGFIDDAFAQVDGALKGWAESNALNKELSAKLEKYEKGETGKDS